MTTCPFCEIIAGRGPVSMIYEDDRVLAFMTLTPFSPGECTVIPREHIDHMTDVSDEVAQHMMLIAQRIGRRMRAVFTPQRVGMIVHGYGVPHAHLILVPQNHPHDITSRHFAHIEDGEIRFSLKNVPVADRATLDEHARLLRLTGV